MFNIEDKAPVANNKQAKGEFKKANAFINLYLPSNTDSGKRKLHAVPLYEDDEAHAGLIKYLQQGGERALTNVANKLMFDFNVVDNTKPRGFELPAIDAE
jgi:hypothetical protein